MSAQLHPADDMLLAYAAGSLDEASSLLVATHATFCPQCRRQIAEAEGVGGSLLQNLPPDRLDESALTALLGRLDQPAIAAQPAPALPGMPAPLRAYVKRRRHEVAWRWLAPGIRQTLVLRAEGLRVRMLKIAPGKPLPHHAHGGIEYTLVIEGAYYDEIGRYGVGDFVIADIGMGHQPVAASEGCVCLVMSGASMRLTGRFGRLLNPFLPF
jgi:putative transcriptional regulator